MAQLTIANCDGCGNLILPGDIIAVITKGFLGEGDGLDIIEGEGSITVTFCDSCASETAATLNSLIAEEEVRTAMEQLLASDDGDSIPEQCDGSGACGACAPRD